MKKIIKLENLECAHCASKMEKAIGKLDGVNNVSISFMAQRLIVESDGEIEALLPEIQKIIKKIEPDCEMMV